MLSKYDFQLGPCDYSFSFFFSSTNRRWAYVHIDLSLFWSGQRYVDSKNKRQPYMLELGDSKEITFLCHDPKNRTIVNCVGSKFTD